MPLNDGGVFADFDFSAFLGCLRLGISLGISTNLEAVTAQYVDVRLERKQSVLQTYHKALQPKTTVTGKEAGQETSKKAKKKSSEMEL